MLDQAAAQEPGNIDALCHRGFLGLGSKESLRFSGHSEAFEDFVLEDRIYRKRAGL